MSEEDKQILKEIARLQKRGVEIRDMVRSLSTD